MKKINILKFYLLTLFFIIICNYGLAQEQSELNDRGIGKIGIGDSLKSLKNITPFSESRFKNNFRVLPNENVFFAVNKDSVFIGFEKLKINFFIISIAKDSCVNNIFIYLQDSKELLKKHIDSKNYKKGWGVSANLTNFTSLSWITPGNIEINLSRVNYSGTGLDTNNVELRFVNLSDPNAFHDFRLYPIWGEK
jgi:hypothetical protein